MEFDFGLPEAVDETREVEVHKGGRCYGVFTLKHQFTGSPEWQLAFKRHNAKLTKRERERIEDPQTVEDFVLRRKQLFGFFIANYIVDSREVPRKDGEWKHSTANLIEYLTNPHAAFIYDELEDFSVELANFRAVDVKDSEKK